jgi:hypothetical protein
VGVSTALELTPEYGANTFGTYLKNIDRRKDSVRASSQQLCVSVVAGSSTA